MLITTRMPDKLEATLKQTEALQTFGYYNTYGSYLTTPTAPARSADKVGRLSFFLAGQPRGKLQPAAGLRDQRRRLRGRHAGHHPGARTRPAQRGNVVGAGGLLHSIMDNYKLKLGGRRSPTG